MNRGCITGLWYIYFCREEEVFGIHELRKRFVKLDKTSRCTDEHNYNVIKSMSPKNTIYDYNSSQIKVTNEQKKGSPKKIP